MKQLMYVEKKKGAEPGPGCIAWVELTRSKRGYRLDGRLLQRCSGYKYNCIDADSGERYWVSGPKRDGRDCLYGGSISIDDDARLEYWITVRKLPQCVTLATSTASARRG